MFSQRMPRVLLSLSLAACAFAADPKDPAEEDPYADLPPKRAALERLLSERGSDEAFETAAAAARKQGVSDQAVLEARFLYLVDRRADDKLAAMLPQFLERKDKFKIEDSEIFAVKEDWLAVVEYVEAIASLKKGDKDGFKKHITEAFWLSPRQGAAFAPHIDRLRMDEAMRNVKIDPATKLAPVTGGDAVSLASLLEKKKAVLLHFWSPWSRECESSMPDFKVVATELLKNDVAVISVLAEDNNDVLDDAKAMIAGPDGAPPGLWMKDREKQPLHQELRIQDVPSMVLLSPEGRVLFNGHPSEDRLWESLSKIAPAIKRPALAEE